MFKNKIIQIPAWRFNEQIISTYFVYILPVHIRALTEIMYIELSKQAMK